MNKLINFAAGDRLLIDDVEHEFVTFLKPENADANAPDDLQFADIRSRRPRVFSRAEFDDLYLAERLVWKITIEHKGDEVPEEHCDDSTLRTLRQTFTKEFDAQPVPKSEGPLRAVFGTVKAKLGLSNEWDRSPGTLRRWLKDRGEPGNRPRKYMGDRRSRGPRGPRIHPVALEVLGNKAERYWVDRQVTAKDVYAEVRVELRSRNAQREVQGLKPIPVPSRPTVWRHLTHHSDYDHARRRHGARVAQRMFVPLKGSLTATRILETVIMDHTVVDCFVVDDQNFVPVGRPFLTFAIDVRSRYPLAFVVGWAPPSLETANACIRRMVRPKRDLATRFPDIRGKWVAFGTPETLLVDNAWEFSGTSFKDACEDAGISIVWAPVRTPEYKGIGERFFRTLNQGLIHKLKGSVPDRPHVLKECGIDPQAGAVLLLSELEELICQHVIEVFGRDFHDGIKAVPEQVWRAREAIDGVQYAHNLRQLHLSLGKIGGERTLSRSGIEFNNLVFCSDEVFGLLDELLPRERKRGVAKGTVRVKFKYWPEDLRKIAIWNQVRQAYVDVPCTQAAYAKGLSEHHHQVLTHYAQELGLKFSSEDERCAARVRLREKIASFVNDRKMGDRRRAQRLAATPQYVPLPEGNNPPELAAEEHIVPIETVSNRVDGDQPDRSAVRRRHPSKKVARSRRPLPGIATPESPATSQPPPARFGSDPFASFDREKLLAAVEAESEEGDGS